MAGRASLGSVMAFSAAPPSTMAFSKTLCTSSSSLGLPSHVVDSFQPSPSPLLSTYPTVTCGRGDKRTAKGKRFRGSYGNARPRNLNKGRGLPQVPLPPRPPKKDPLDEGEFVEIIIDDNIFRKKS